MNALQFALLALLGALVVLAWQHIARDRALRLSMLSRRGTP